MSGLIHIISPESPTGTSPDIEDETLVAKGAGGSPSGEPLSTVAP